MSTVSKRLAGARLYLVCDAIADERLDAALHGGVDIVQLRAKGADDDALLAAAERFAGCCERHGALFILNDRPDLVAAAGADGVHVGQDDMPVAQARKLVGPDRIVGLSTHTPAQVVESAGASVRSADADPIGRIAGGRFFRGVDYIGVGPVHSTPTKPGRAAVGDELVRYAAATARVPFFAIGGIDEATIGGVLAAGAVRVAVVRAITDADDPERAARLLRAALTESEIGVGAT